MRASGREAQGRGRPGPPGTGFGGGAGVGTVVVTRQPSLRPGVHSPVGSPHVTTVAGLAFDGLLWDGRRVGRHVGLVGCVSQKAAGPRPARDLYTSALFRGRRGYVERACDRWWILSALHGLVDPDAVLAPYDVTLTRASVAQRRAWSARVLSQLREMGDLGAGDVVEIHAGADYRDYGLVEGLRAQGVAVVVPTEGLRLGEQLRFYRVSGAS